MEIKPATVKLVSSAFDRDRSVVPVLPFRAQKDALPSGETGTMLDRSTPEAEGISSKLIADFLNEVASNPVINMHSLMIIKNGKVICEARRTGYEPDDWHQTFSLCKSITGLAIGLLYDEGRIDLNSSIWSYFPAVRKPLAQRLRPDVTVANLLCMTSGFDFAEAGAAISADWISDFFSSAEKFEPGQRFQYNSMNTYMLASILRVITGEGLCDYLRPRLFEPLGITDYLWETAPNGTEKGGFGLYLRTEDAAKLGILVLNGGVYGGKRILSEEWIQKMTAVHAHPTSTHTKFEYGYQIWVTEDTDIFLFNGLFGQNVTGIRSAGIVISSNAGSDVAFQEGPYFTILDKYFFHPSLTYDVSGNRADLRSLNASVRNFTRAFSPLWHRKMHPFFAYLMLRKYRDRVFRPDPAEPSLSVLPKLLQMIQNNYPGGIDGISVSLFKDTLLVRFSENGRMQDIPFGLRRPARSILTFQSEDYLVSGSAKLGLDDSRNPVAEMRLDFVETVSSRLIRFVFEGDRIHVYMREEPGPKLLESYADNFAEAIRGRPIIGNIAERVDIVDFIKLRVYNAMVPEFIAIERKEQKNKTEDIEKAVIDS